MRVQLLITLTTLLNCEIFLEAKKNQVLDLLSVRKYLTHY